MYPGNIIKAYFFGSFKVFWDGPLYRIGCFHGAFISTLHNMADHLYQTHYLLCTYTQQDIATS